MKEKLVSVIVPVYNVEQELDECVSSLVDQSYRNLEILLVDDGATDSSGRMCDAWAEKDARVSVIHKKNGGLSDARNAGLNSARGEYITFVDGDDWLDPDAIQAGVLEAEKHNAQIVFWPFTIELASSKEERHFFDQSCVFEGEKVQSELARKICGPNQNELRYPERINWTVTAWGKLFQTEHIRKYGSPFIDLKIIGVFEDGLFNLDLFAHANTVVYLDHAWYHYRKNREGQLTATYKPNLFEQYRTLCMLLREKKAIAADYTNQSAFNNRICVEMITHALNVSASEMSFSEKRKALSDILNSDLYRTAFRKFSTAGMRPHWKVFYLCCKYRLMTGVTLLSEAMFQIRERRNNG